MEKKGHGNPRACMCTHTQDLHAHASCIRTHTWAYVRILGFQKLWKTSFFELKFSFGTNPTAFRSRSKTPFSDYKKPYMVPFWKTQKILKENTRFTKNSESKREIFHKTSSSQYFSNWGLSGLDLRVSSLLITSLFDCE